MITPSIYAGNLPHLLPYYKVIPVHNQELDNISFVIVGHPSGQKESSTFLHLNLIQKYDTADKVPDETQRYSTYDQP
jgi:hypothetical protein